MKRLFFGFIFCFMLFPLFLKAECSYKEQNNLNKLASYISSSYEYDENTNMFNVKLLNVNDNMLITYINTPYYQVNGEVNIYGIEEGKSVNISVTSINSGECDNINLRTIRLNIPYINPYYNSNECNNRKDLSVCNSKFLSYKLSYNTFIKLINEKSTNKKKDQQEIIEENKEETFYDKYSNFVNKYWIPIILCLVSIVITYIIGKTLLRKEIHGI